MHYLIDSNYKLINYFIKDKTNYHKLVEINFFKFMVGSYHNFNLVEFFNFVGVNY